MINLFIPLFTFLSFHHIFILLLPPLFMFLCLSPHIKDVYPVWGMGEQFLLQSIGGSRTLRFKPGPCARLTGLVIVCMALQAHTASLSLTHTHTHTHTHTTRRLVPVKMFNCCKSSDSHLAFSSSSPNATVYVSSLSQAVKHTTALLFTYQLPPC